MVVHRRDSFVSICQWHETEKLVPRHREPEKEEEEIDLDPERLRIITKKERKVRQARGDSLLKLPCGSRNTDSQGFRTGNYCQNGGYWAIQNHR